MKKKRVQWFNLLMGLFIILLPFQTRWIYWDWKLGDQIWQYGRLSIYGSIVVLLAAAIVFGWKNRKELKFSKNKFVYFVFGYSILVTFLSIIPLVSFHYLSLIYLAALFAYLVRFVPRDIVYKAFFVSGLIQSILALQQLFIQKVIASKFFGISAQLPQNLGVSVVEYGESRLLRAYAALPHPNILGGFLFLCLFIGILLWVNFYRDAARHQWKNVFGKKNVAQIVWIVFSLVVISFGLLATFSRTALLALAASLASMIIIGILRRKWLLAQVALKFLLIFAVVFWIFTSWFPGAWESRISANGRLEQQSIDQRIASLQEFSYANYRQALVGQGIGMNSAAAYFKDPFANVNIYQPIHNIFLLGLAEIGIVGMLIVLQIIRFLLRKADNVEIMTTALLFGLLIIGIFDHYLWTSWTGLLMIFFGLVNLHKQSKVS